MTGGLIVAGFSITQSVVRYQSCRSNIDLSAGSSNINTLHIYNNENPNNKKCAAESTKLLLTGNYTDFQLTVHRNWILDKNLINIAHHQHHALQKTSENT